MNSSKPSSTMFSYGGCVTILLLLCLILLPSIAWAAVGDPLPFEGNVKLLRNAMKGPVATIISLVGIVGCGAMLIFGGEISGFARTMVFLVLVISVIVQAENIVEVLGGAKIGSLILKQAS